MFIDSGDGVPVGDWQKYLRFGRRFPPGLCRDPLPRWGRLGCGLFSGAVPPTDRADQEVTSAEWRTNLVVPRTAPVAWWSRVGAVASSLLLTERTPT